MRSARARIDYRDQGRRSDNLDQALVGDDSAEAVPSTMSYGDACQRRDRDRHGALALEAERSRPTTECRTRGPQKERFTMKLLCDPEEAGLDGGQAQLASPRPRLHGGLLRSRSSPAPPRGGVPIEAASSSPARPALPRHLRRSAGRSPLVAPSWPRGIRVAGSACACSTMTPIDELDIPRALVAQQRFAHAVIRSSIDADRLYRGGRPTPPAGEPHGYLVNDHGARDTGLTMDAAVSGSRQLHPVAHHRRRADRRGGTCVRPEEGDAADDVVCAQTPTRARRAVGNGTSCSTKLADWR